MIKQSSSSTHGHGPSSFKRNFLRFGVCVFIMIALFYILNSVSTVSSSKDRVSSHASDYAKKTKPTKSHKSIGNIHDSDVHNQGGAKGQGHEADDSLDAGWGHKLIEEEMANANKDGSNKASANHNNAHSSHKDDAHARGGQHGGAAGEVIDDSDSGDASLFDWKAEKDAEKSVKSQPSRHGKDLAQAKQAADKEAEKAIALEAQESETPEVVAKDNEAVAVGEEKEGAPEQQTVRKEEPSQPEKDASAGTKTDANPDRLVQDEPNTSRDRPSTGRGRLPVAKKETSKTADKKVSAKPKATPAMKAVETDPDADIEASETTPENADANADANDNEAAVKSSSKSGSEIDPSEKSKSNHEGAGENKMKEVLNDNNIENDAIVAETETEQDTPAKEVVAEDATNSKSKVEKVSKDKLAGAKIAVDDGSESDNDFAAESNNNNANGDEEVIARAKPGSKANDRKQTDASKPRKAATPGKKDDFHSARANGVAGHLRAPIFRVKPLPKDDDIVADDAGVVAVHRQFGRDAHAKDAKGEVAKPQQHDSDTGKAVDAADPVVAERPKVVAGANEEDSQASDPDATTVGEQSVGRSGANDEAKQAPRAANLAVTTSHDNLVTSDAADEAKSAGDANAGEQQQQEQQEQQEQAETSAFDEGHADGSFGSAGAGEHIQHFWRNHVGMMGRKQEKEGAAQEEAGSEGEERTDAVMGRDEFNERDASAASSVKKEQPQQQASAEAKKSDKFVSKVLELTTPEQ